MESIDKLPWQALKFFYHVARLGRLDAAAECLHVTAGAVSKQIKGLEAAVGTALFVKQGRYLVLNVAGQHLYGACEVQYRALQQALLHIKQQDSDLRVSCEPTLAMKWLIPRLPEFKRRHPQWNVVILAAGGAVDFAGQHVDVAIRRNDFAWPKHVQAHKLADEYMAPVSRTGEHKALRLHSNSRASAWKTWLAQQHEQNAEVADAYAAMPSTTFEHFYLAIQAAIAGMGTAMASLFMVADELDQHILQAEQPFTADGSSYYLLSSNDISTHTKTAEFGAWLREEMGETLTYAFKMKLVRKV
ncbi:LysR substrate-binding domain-containing protein [Vitreoscilla massiliensis]|uniref:LysR substrate-binding domain-containing protein n=1 Tax=Vitreoscilla massiliensis TaxID=1689272 RepID=A0ABY4E0K4_9NEIS|nr:LysR substrate-binding domain-containing protein [Vitreoscilla massiliensis]UOO89303.1 LysR substrate-binding domain-containing protein [Vitreoscilla massiliensis]